MKTKKTYRYPTALTIAGSDSGGGAGIQADIKTFSALGVYGASVITSVTAQNTEGVRGIQPITPEILEGQLDAVFEDFTIDAVKIGMLHNKEAARIVARSFERFTPCNVILDPVMISTSGNRLLENEAIEIIVEELFRRVTLVTPNIDEAAYLTGISIYNEQDMCRAACKLMDMGCRSVLMKGGHLLETNATDLLFTPCAEPVRFASPAVRTENTHGTGCTLSSAIAAYMALGKELTDAVRRSKIYVTKAIKAGADVHSGLGHGPLNHFFSPQALQKRKI